MLLLTKRDTHSKALVLLAALAGCGGGDGGGSDGGADLAPPPRICKAPTGPHAMPWFEDAAASVGLDGMHGNSVFAGDFDGDGFSDLIVLTGSSERGVPMSGPLAGQPLRFLFLNRPSPAGD